MASENEITNEVVGIQGGNVTFAPDVIATIAYLAAADIEGVDGMASGVVEGLSGILNSKKNYTKGVKVDINEKDVNVDISIIVKYGFKLHEVCANIQKSIKNAIETMTGLNVVAVNIAVQSISFEKPEKPEKSAEKKPEGEEVQQ